MNRILVDTHTHTISSIHAYSTIEENIRHAAGLGLEGLAMTDHFPPGKNPWDLTGFTTAHNKGALPKVVSGVRVLAGAEIDIVDFKGRLAGHDITLPNGNNACMGLLKDRDIAIASLHEFPGSCEGTLAQNTEMYCGALLHPNIDILGHCGRPGISFDIAEVVRTAKAAGKLIEINSLTLRWSDSPREACRKVALCCAEQGAYVTVGSDAHSSFFVGDFSEALALLAEIHFPWELIANTSLQKLEKVLGKDWS